MREGIILRCSDCKHENYVGKNDKKKEKIEASKYCPNCNKHTVHKQKK
ncbi:50S ribosomal protein L33 [Williamsoniiplasma luminosum]|uniref:Large ribosomal subunit protein bL33 n=1 Tax=Williamsoniiplasma luminosum TaxID=214888 RepID=A0A2K8NTT7_9MOLU|nr:50S ribosomal protein L33 [Williamsoniiplasma luminosum]ATZ17174.1 50S ribosomal protein L33 [Williamsoniiplasma luminosum]AVP49039.1 MAG: 50S ribosomal protein L33 [Williamsoniiplasma luminosum]